MTNKNAVSIRSAEVRLAQFADYIFVVHVAMPPEEVSLVQQSFQKVAPLAHQAAELFYKKLFQIAPELRRLFPPDMTRQQNKFVQMLGALIPNLQRIDILTEEIQALGRRHAAYDVVDWHYAVVGRTLVATLEEMLGPHFTPQIKRAWTSAYSMIAFVMKESVHAERQGGNYLEEAIFGTLVAHYGIGGATLR